MSNYSIKNSMYASIYRILCELRELDENWELSIPESEELYYGNFRYNKEQLVNTAYYLLELEYGIWAYHDVTNLASALTEVLNTLGYTDIPTYWIDTKEEYEEELEILHELHPEWYEDE